MKGNESDIRRQQTNAEMWTDVMKITGSLMMNHVIYEIRVSVSNQIIMMI